jgi:hypothetical protein
VWIGGIWLVALVLTWLICHWRGYNVAAWTFTIGAFSLGLFVGAENTTHGRFKVPFLSGHHHLHLIHHTASRWRVIDRRHGTAEETQAYFIERDHNGQTLAYVYFEDETGRQDGPSSAACSSTPASPAPIGKRHPEMLHDVWQRAILHDVPSGARCGLADRVELARQRMGGTDLVVPISAD